MNTPTPDASRRGFEFRQLVSLVLQLADVPAQARPPRPRTLHERLEQPQEPSDVLGVPDWLLRTHTASARDLALGVDEAQAAAAEAKVPYFAAIWKRPRKAAHDAYVIMPLQQFANIIHELEKNSEKNSEQDL